MKRDPRQIILMWVSVAVAIAAVLVVYHACRTAGAVRAVSSNMPRVIEQAHARGPIHAVDSLMDEYRKGSYVVARTIDLDVDPSDPNQVLYEYKVSSQDGSQMLIFRWAWRAPNGMPVENNPQAWERLDEWVFLPLTADAERVQSRLGY